MDLFKIENNRPKISFFLYSIKAVKSLWNFYPKNKDVPMNIILYAFYLYDLSDINPYRDIPEEEKPIVIGNVLFGADQSPLQHSLSKQLLRTFKLLSDENPLRRRIEILKTGIASLEDVVRNFDSTAASVEAAKDFSMLLKNLKGNYSDLYDAEKLLTVRRKEDLGNELEQFYE